MPDQLNTNDYDSEPVQYCSRCYSLRIKYEEAIDSDCCMDCGCSDVLTANIEEWERMFEKRYGKKYVERDSDPRRTPIFNLSLSKLKLKVFEHPNWRGIILSLYPRFPMGLGKADSVIMLFDKLIKDNRLDDLRFLLLKQLKTKKT